ncbi:hypothetical protein ANO11243_018160 [Dothideomycetidae sp. 11243]|nr:hypothetical protein ANO11243_018160 [fungal sp. No.11243]
MGHDRLSERPYDDMQRRDYRPGRAGENSAEGGHDRGDCTRAVTPKIDSLVKNAVRAAATVNPSDSSHVVPLVQSEAARYWTAADMLSDQFGIIYARPINAPSTTIEEERLRIAPTGRNGHKHQRNFVKALLCLRRFWL